jgi:hypothetical protein
VLLTADGYEINRFFVCLFFSNEGAGTRLVETLCYKLVVGRRFDSRWGHLDFSIDLILPATPWPWGLTRPLKEMSTRNLPGGKGGPTT